jgi:hypothetical protein
VKTRSCLGPLKSLPLERRAKIVCGSFFSTGVLAISAIDGAGDKVTSESPVEVIEAPKQSPGDDGRKELAESSLEFSMRASIDFIGEITSTFCGTSDLTSLMFRRRPQPIRCCGYSEYSAGRDVIEGDSGDSGVNSNSSADSEQGDRGVYSDPSSDSESVNGLAESIAVSEWRIVFISDSESE